MSPYFTARTLHPILLMQIHPDQTEKAVWVLSESDRFRHIASAIAEQFPGWQFGEWAEWLGQPIMGEVIEFPLGAIAA